MLDYENMGVAITLDRERRMVFNLNVLEAYNKKYGDIEGAPQNMAKNIEIVRWLAIQMLNEGAEIWNEDHPDNKIPPMDEAKLNRYIYGIKGLEELQKKIHEAMFAGMSKDQIDQIYALGNKLVAAESSKQEARGNE